MPYIRPHRNSYIELVHQFSLLVKKYQQIIEQDSAARCMIGFTAAQLIRDTSFHLSIDSIEDWLKSRLECDSKMALEGGTSIQTLINILEEIDGSTLEQPSFDRSTTTRLLSPE
ncbi:unnamed protein product [Rhizopus stolonifer]